MARRPKTTDDPLALFHAPTRRWFEGAFAAPTAAQAKAWPPIARGESTLLLAPTGSGKTLAAFLSCLDRVMFAPAPEPRLRCRVVYVSPLRALAVDIERNLRAPLVGIAEAARAMGLPCVVPEVMVRTGDTPAAERARFSKKGADIAITTPESLYLLLTSGAREALRGVETVIVDEIHALVPRKRGAHLALSLERLQAWVGRPLQRIGLSATQRPLDEVARFLGGAEPGDDGPRRKTARAGDASPQGKGEAAVRALHGELGDARAASHRAVTVVDAAGPKALELRVEVPVEDMARLDLVEPLPSGPASSGPQRPSVWPAIHPRLLELVRAHRTTLVFVNGRRLAERLAGALNDLAGELLVEAHHGSIARTQRVEIEDRLKRGQIRGLVATSSLELGIDMGAIDLVIQIECPPSVASGLQRVGRAGHSVGAASQGVLFPKFRGDLLACAAASRAMREGAVESTRYPRNPLDVLAQQVVAMASMEPWSVDDLFARVRCAAPFADLSRAAFDGVLDMLAGRYVSDDFAELRPRLTWDRLRGTLTARDGARRVAVTNAGTIPDRGLYGVYLAGGETARARIGELDEEMVNETKAGETFVLGASTWRVEEITHDRVLVSPAPGEPGKMPFWKGDREGRPLELGRRIGRLARELAHGSREAALAKLREEHDLDALAAENLVRYIEDQREASAVPDERTVVIERCRDELGDFRLCVLSPLGGRVHAPWSIAVAERIRAERGLDCESLWNDDGFVIRFPDTDVPPPVDLLLPGSAEVESLVLSSLPGTSLFAARFREAAGRALLLPRRRPGGRTPLWQQRKRAADLLAVAARFPAFPMVLEAMRECLRDVFDLPGLVEVLAGIERRTIRVVARDPETPSPFASSLLFSYVATYLYDGDAPLAERRAQALSIDVAQLRELLGDVDLRALLDVDAVAEVEAELQGLGDRPRARGVDGLHDLLLRLGDLSRVEIDARCEAGQGEALAERLLSERRAIEVSIGGERRLIAVEDAARYRDGLGVPLPMGLPEALLEPVPEPRADLVRRFARTHGPFTDSDVCARFGLSTEAVRGVTTRLCAEGKLVVGELRPGGSGRELCEPGVLRLLRRRSLAKARREVAPVEPAALGRMAMVWHGLARPGRGLDGLLDAVERLQGYAIPASILERDLLAARVEGYRADMLDALLSAGEIVWRGVEPLGERDGRVALYLTDHAPLIAHLGAPTADESALSEREERIMAHLRGRGASFFGELLAAVGGFPRDVVDALWRLVWRGLVTNDSMHALRAFVRGESGRSVARRRHEGRGIRDPFAGFRSRRQSSPLGEGRWSLTAPRFEPAPTPTEVSAAMAAQLLARHGLVTREVASIEAMRGGFSSVYEALRAMDEAGRARRGYFVSGVGALQFASPAALDLLRAAREPGAPASSASAPDHCANREPVRSGPGAPASLASAPDHCANREPVRSGPGAPASSAPEAYLLSAVDPANPFGIVVPWPKLRAEQRSPARAAGAYVVLVDGLACAYLARGGRALSLFLPEAEPERGRASLGVAHALAAFGARLARAGGVLLLEEIDGAPARPHVFAAALREAGFVAGYRGVSWPRFHRAQGAATEAPSDDEPLPPGFDAATPADAAVPPFEDEDEGEGR